MGNYGSDRRGGRGGGRRPERREMFSAVCDKCGRDCQVPFEPRGDKPIYCSDCFEDVEDRGSRSGGRRSFGGRDDRGGRRGGDSDVLLKKLDFIERKLDAILEILEEEDDSTTYSAVEKNFVERKKKEEKVEEDENKILGLDMI